MKYKKLKQIKKNENIGGDYWRDTNFADHLNLTNHQTSYQYINDYFSPPMKILEAGCGIGRWVIPLAEKGFDVTGIEIHNEALDIIRQNYNSSNLNLIEGDIFNMPFDSNSFDLVLSLGVLEHFEDKNLQQQAINEHIRVIKKEGIFFVTVPFINFARLIIHIPFVKLVSFVRKLKGKQEYFTEYRYSKNEFKTILEKSGLKVVDIVYDDMSSPYNFGLIVDYPINRYFKHKDGTQYKANKIGDFIFRLLWKIHPALVSGGIGFVCKKHK